MKRYILFGMFAFIIGANAISQTVVNFNYTGAVQNWIVPPCVNTIQVDVRGGKGANSTQTTGGNGARVTATLAVTPGQTLNIYVGGQGGNPTAGWNGGGAGGAGGAPGGSSGGGGGASDIRIGGTALANRVIVAGGGGGGGGGFNLPVMGMGGAGGCTTGNSGTSSTFAGLGTGGSQTAGGLGGYNYPGGQWGFNGALGVGGNGGFWGDASGGGGGGGYYGGGGGGSDGCCSGANGGGGGGGGSSFTPAGGICTANYNNGAGLITITYTGIPPMVANNTGPYCAGATINLSIGAGGTNYDWTGPNGYSQNSTQNPTIPNSTVAMGGVYTVTITAPGGCTTTSTTTVVVNANPTAVANNTGPYCSGDLIQLNSPNGSATDDWTGPNGYNQPNTLNPTIAGATPSMSGVYTVVVTGGGSCSSSATTTVVVNPDPIPVANNTGPYCEGEQVDLTSNGGTDYDWIGPGGFTLNNTQNATFPAAMMTMNGTYTVTVTDANGCSETATTTMVVNLMPIPVANNDGPYCEGDPISLTSGGGSTYGWSGPGGYTSSTQNPVMAPSTVAMTGNYVVNVTTAQGCSATASTNVVVTALPIPTASNGGPYCELEKLELFATGGTSYAWTGPLAFTSSAQNPSINSSIPGNTGTYTVIVTDVAGCTASSTTAVIVSPTPTAVPYFTPQNPTTLKPDVYFHDGSYSNIITWEWEIDGMVYNTPTFTHTFATSGLFTGMLSVTNSYGCFDTTVFSIYVKPEIAIYIPNSFTPNGDGLNDILYVYGFNWSRMDFTIFDRWGSEVFHTADPEKGWNGSMNNNGEILMLGTYAYKVYIIDEYGKEHDIMGHVNLLK